MIEKLRGAMTAIITPFDDRGAVDQKALARFVSAQIEGGIDGIVACGTTGETPTLTLDEQEQVVRTSVEAVAGRKPVIAGTGSNSTAAAAAQTSRAKAWGIDAALVVCPYYNKPTQEGLYQHFKAVYEASGISIIAYNVPGRTASDLQPETLGRLVQDGIIIGVKDATANMIRAADTKAVVGDRPFAMMSGDDFTILPFVALGGSGVVSVVSNIAPAATSRLVKESAAGNWDVARPLNQRIIKLSRALFKVSNPIPIKATAALCGWCERFTRLPLVDADDALMRDLEGELRAFAGGGLDRLEGYLG